MTLQNKNAVIYGAGGSLGGAVAKALADAGANVFLTGRNSSSVQKVADEILKSGGIVEVDVVDALDENAVNKHIESVVKKAGSVDISFNAVGVDILMNVPLVDISVDDYVSPVTMTMQTRFITAKHQRE